MADGSGGAWRWRWRHRADRAGAVLAVALVLCGRADPSPATPAAVPRFALFGWVSPPPAATTAERYAELAGAGMNVALPAWDDPHQRSENLRRLDLAAAVGIRCLVADERFATAVTLGLDTPAAGAVVDSIVADYRAHPGFLGYYLGDEPKSDAWPVLAKLFAMLRVRDPEHPAWNNLSGISGFPDRAAWEAHHRGYLEGIRPAVLCNDHYDFRVGYDRNQFVENVAGLRAWSLQHVVPFWCIVQLVPHANIRPLTAGELTWQVAMLLAYGARGVGYFTYWTPAPDPLWNWGDAILTYEGERTRWYDVVAALNRAVHAAGETLAGLTWVSTQHAGSVPPGGEVFQGGDWLRAVEGRAAVGRFVDGTGVPFLLVVNSDSLAAQTVALSLVGARGVSRLGKAPEAWEPLPVAGERGVLRLPLALPAGDFALLRIDGTFDPRRGSRLGPALRLTPSPAVGEVRFDLERLAGAARLDVLDPAGRRVWSRALPVGRASVVWRGESPAGGTAARGVYLVRVSDARGATAVRLAWLGGR